jgi:hypothetical protein
LAATVEVRFARQLLRFRYHLAVRTAKGKVVPIQTAVIGNGKLKTLFKTINLSRRESRQILVAAKFGHHGIVGLGSHSGNVLICDGALKAILFVATHILLLRVECRGGPLQFVGGGVGLLIHVLLRIVHRAE